MIYKLYGLDYVVYCIVKKYITRCDYLPYYLQDNSRYLLYDCVNHTYGQTGTEVDEYRDEVKVAILSSLANGNSHEVAISDGYEALKSYLGRDNFDARTNKKLDREEINDIDFIPVVQDICSLNSKRVATTDTKYQGYFEQYFIKEIYDIFDEVKKEHPFVKESKWHMFEKHMLNMSDSDIASEHKVSPQVVNKAWHQIQGWLLEKVANLTQVEREGDW